MLMVGLVKKFSNMVISSQAFPAGKEGSETRWFPKRGM